MTTFSLSNFLDMMSEQTNVCNEENGFAIHFMTSYPEHLTVKKLIKSKMMFFTIKIYHFSSQNGTNITQSKKGHFLSKQIPNLIGTRLSYSQFNKIIKLTFLITNTSRKLSHILISLQLYKYISFGSMTFSFISTSRWIYIVNICSRYCTSIYVL